VNKDNIGLDMTNTHFMGHSQEGLLELCRILCTSWLRLDLELY
jgi:hypothetical protein